METANIKQAIILLEDNDSKMFPFDNKSISVIPIGNIENIRMIVDKLNHLGIEEIIIVGNNFDKERHILRNHENIKFLNATRDLNEVLASIIENKDTLIHNIRSYVSLNDLKTFIQGDLDGLNKVLLQSNYDNSFNYKDYICANAEENVTAFFAHPRSSYVNSRSTGVFIIRKEYSEYIRNNSNEFINVNVGVIKEDGFFIEQSLNDLINDGIKVKAIYCADGFVNLRFSWDILEANYIETHNLDDGVSIGESSIVDETVIFDGKAKIGKNCKINNGAIIGDGVIIGDNTIVTNYAKITKNTVIGNRNKLGYNSEVTGVTYDNVAIVHNSHICGLIGSNVDIGAGTMTANLRFDDLNESIIVDGRRYSNMFTNYVFIGESTRTGIGSLLSPGVRIGANSAIGSGALITSDVMKNKIVIVKQEQIIKDWGSKKHGW